MSSSLSTTLPLKKQISNKQYGLQQQLLHQLPSQNPILIRNSLQRKSSRFTKTQKATNLASAAAAAAAPTAYRTRNRQNSQRDSALQPLIQPEDLTTNSVSDFDSATCMGGGYSQLTITTTTATSSTRSRAASQSSTFEFSDNYL